MLNPSRSFNVNKELQAVAMPVDGGRCGPERESGLCGEEQARPGLAPPWKSVHPNDSGEALLGSTRSGRKVGHPPAPARPAADGHEAVASLEVEVFDVVLMDLEMRGMDGFEATAAIRARERSTGAHVHIIAV